MLQHQEVLSELDSAGTINGGTTDTHVLAVDPGDYVEWYGTIFSFHQATTTLQTLELRVSFASAGQIARVAAAIPTTVTVAKFEIQVFPPPGTKIRGADGDDLQVVIQNTSAANAVTGARSTTFYQRRKTVKGNP